MSHKKQPALPNTLQSLTKAIKSYIGLVDNFSYEGTVFEHLNTFSYHSDLRDNTLFHHEHVAKTLLIALAKRKLAEIVANEIGDDSYDDLIRLLTGVINLTERLQTERMEAELLLADLEHAHPDHKSVHGYYPTEDTAQFLLEKYTKLNAPYASTGKLLTAA